MPKHRIYPVRSTSRSTPDLTNIKTTTSLFLTHTKVQSGIEEYGGHALFIWDTRISQKYLYFLFAKLCLLDKMSNKHSLMKTRKDLSLLGFHQ